MPNHLIHEKSPYLIQHAHNPVDWRPWSEEAFAEARAQDKPVFLSIGYATCHWCHVMERESFEDEEAAGRLNETFVCIKVDREERPDIDAVYMAVCQMLTGNGGWPLTVFLTPDKRPFFAGTYFPKRTRHGRVGLIEICEQVKRLWSERRDDIDRSADAIHAALGKAFSYTTGDTPEASLPGQAYRQIASRFDPEHAGFGPAPKFPTPHRLLFLLRYHHRTGETAAREMVARTLIRMRMGGIWDHVGYGFHRYSTDERWFLPHFEKMLYDQALMAMTYLEAFQIQGDRHDAETAEEIFAYVLRDMTSPEGGFYSAEDADSEGEEGKFYVWTEKEFLEAAGPETGRRWVAIFRLDPDGNFLEEASRRKTGANILHLTAPLADWAERLGIPHDPLKAEWTRLRQALFDIRERRVHPLKDDKILTDWNGLMIAALAQGARVLNRPDYETAARRSARFILDRMRDGKDRLYHRFREGHVAVRGQASDYAFLILGLLNLYRTTFDLAFAEEALALQERMIEDFWDRREGGFFSTPEDADDLPARPKELYDGAVPSANSVSLFNLATLFRLTGDPQWDERAQRLVQAFSGTVASQPEAYAFFLCGLDFAISPSQEVIIAGERNDPDTGMILAALNRRYAPNRVAILKSAENSDRLDRFAPYTRTIPLTEKPRIYLCSNGACTLSTDNPREMIAQLTSDPPK